ESFLTPLIESFPPPEFILLKKTIVGGSIFSRQRGSVYIQQRHCFCIAIIPDASLSKSFSGKNCASQDCFLFFFLLS
ncbi:hypothetical protein SE940_14085, partial [Legionella pneumophila]|nr:hypothetical protein [Legionella pneumophila]MDW9091861.1 hypothetical protein [Legionella pneumophila]MDW9094836.1 hypothetical protein [Legionella pneumophila]MDW9100901.1 hypothetical protein [Legionella pneumophila]